MGKPEYANLFTVSANDVSGEITLAFYNDWYNQLDLMQKRESPERNTEQVASLVMSHHNVRELSKVLSALVANLETNRDDNG